MTPDTLRTIVHLVTWATWSAFVLMMVSLAWVVRHRATLSPTFLAGYTTNARRGQRSGVWVFALILLCAWEGVLWQGVVAFLPIWLMFAIAHVVLSRYAKHGEV